MDDFALLLSHALIAFLSLFLSLAANMAMKITPPIVPPIAPPVVKSEEQEYDQGVRSRGSALADAYSRKADVVVRGYGGYNTRWALFLLHHIFPLIREGLHYNPYFHGGAIAMPKMLNDEAVEYEDGVPATEAQMGKDIVSFLSWAAEPEMEERKLMGFKWIFLLSLALLQAAYYRRLRWSVLKSRKLVLDVVN